MQPNIQPTIPTHQQQTTEPHKAAEKGKKDGTKNIVYTVLLFILAPLFALIMIVFVFQSYVVDGSSMEPNLQNGNRVFILKLPKTFENLRGKEFIPARYEIIVFKKPIEPNVQLIKRVIGLPGDRVVVSDSQIAIYNAANPDGFNPDYDKEYAKLLGPTSGSIDVVVGKDQLFVVGDNRYPGGSLDSRSGLGLVPVQNIVGRLWIKYFPLSEFKIFSALKSVLLSAPTLAQTRNL